MRYRPRDTELTQTVRISRGARVGSNGPGGAGDTFIQLLLGNICIMRTPQLTGVLRAAGTIADLDPPGPAARPVLPLRTSDLAAAPRGSR
jgi:hypothetical protein